jgi:hypothetical protein
MASSDLARSIDGLCLTGGRNQEMMEGHGPHAGYVFVVAAILTLPPVLMVQSGRAVARTRTLIRRTETPKLFWFTVAAWIIGPLALWIVGLKWLLIG